MAWVKLVTYNIRQCRGMDDKVKISRIADTLNWLQADLICLQEVDMRRARSHFENQASVLAKRLGMQYAFGAAIHYTMGAFGNAILSRFPLLKNINYQLPAPKPQRSMLEVEVKVKGRKLRVFNTHLELNWKLRQEQVQNYIVPLINSSEEAAVFAGDLNEDPDGLAVSCLDHYFLDSFAANRGPLTYTFPADDPKERMDYVFLNHSCRILDYRIVRSLASDHLPVAAKIEF